MVRALTWTNHPTSSWHSTSSPPVSRTLPRSWAAPHIQEVILLLIRLAMRQYCKRQVEKVKESRRGEETESHCESLRSHSNICWFRRLRYLLQTQNRTHKDGYETSHNAKVMQKQRSLLPAYYGLHLSQVMTPRWNLQALLEGIWNFKLGVKL